MLAPASYLGRFSLPDPESSSGSLHQMTFPHSARLLASASAEGDNNGSEGVMGRLLAPSPAGLMGGWGCRSAVPPDPGTLP